MTDDAAYWRDRARTAEDLLAEAHHRDYQRWKDSAGAPFAFCDALRRCGTDLIRVDTRVGDMPATLVVRPSGHLYDTDEQVGEAWRAVTQAVAAATEAHRDEPGVTRVRAGRLPTGILTVCWRTDSPGGQTARIGDMRQMDARSRRQVRELLAPRLAKRRGRAWLRGLPGVPLGAGVAALAKKSILAPVVTTPAALSVATAVLLAPAAPAAPDDPTLVQPSRVHVHGRVTPQIPPPRLVSNRTPRPGLQSKAPAPAPSAIPTTATPPPLSRDQPPRHLHRDISPTRVVQTEPGPVEPAPTGMGPSRVMLPRPAVHHAHRRMLPVRLHHLIPRHRIDTGRDHHGQHRHGRHKQTGNQQ